MNQKPWIWLCAGILCACCQAFGQESPQPKWIWYTASVPAAPAGGAKPIEACFRRTVTIPAGARITTALLAVTVDGSCRLYVNGTLIDEKRTDWQSVWGVKLARRLKPGRNVLAVVSSKAWGVGGLIGRLKVNFESGAPLEIVTDRQWRQSTAPAADWTSPDLNDELVASVDGVGAGGDWAMGQSEP